MGTKTDEEFAFAVLRHKIDEENLDSPEQLDCVKTLLASDNPTTLDIVHETLDIVADTTPSHSNIRQLKRLRLKFRDRYTAITAS